MYVVESFVIDVSSQAAVFDSSDIGDLPGMSEEDKEVVADLFFIWALFLDSTICTFMGQF